MKGNQCLLYPVATAWVVNEDGDWEKAINILAEDGSERTIFVVDWLRNPVMAALRLVGNGEHREVVALVHHVATNWDQTAEQDENELLMSGEAAEGVEE
jgi:hypothetical protein